MTQLLFTAFSTRDDARELASAAQTVLASKGVEASLHLLDQPGQPEVTANSLVVSLGGDGTFLRSARLAHAAGAMVLAVNLGRVGFLLDVPATDLVASVLAALAAPRVVERLALSVDVNGTDVFALNEVVVERASTGHMVRVRTFVGDDEFLTYSADGVMVATPTGSTGYNFSAGGPVVDTSLGVLIVTPIAPHFTIDRSIVVDGEKVVRLMADNKPALIVADGVTVATLEPGESIEVRRASHPLHVVRSGEFELGLRLRASLREGHA